MTAYLFLINTILPTLLASVIVIALFCYVCVFRLILATASDISSKEVTDVT